MIMPLRPGWFAREVRISFAGGLPTYFQNIRLLWDYLSTRCSTKHGKQVLENIHILCWVAADHIVLVDTYLNWRYFLFIS